MRYGSGDYEAEEVFFPFKAAWLVPGLWSLSNVPHAGAGAAFLDVHVVGVHDDLEVDLDGCKRFQRFCNGRFIFPKPGEPDLPTVMMKVIIPQRASRTLLSCLKM